MGELPPIEIIVAIAFVIFFGIGLHEYAHCKFADLAGDPTPRFYGRVTLDLTKHFEPVGTAMMMLSSLYGIGLGWGRPAPMNTSRMRNPRWDGFTAVLAGPASNLVQALIYGIILRLMLSNDVLSTQQVISAANRDSTTILAAILTLGVFINLSLMLFNLIPLGPLDGHWLIGYLMPERPRLKWFRFNQTTGGLILIGLILFSQIARIPILGLIIGPPLYRLFYLITGLSV